MNELVITPNFEKKSAKIRGRCAAGEHVLVRLVGMAGLPAETLRLCIMLRERLFTVFPLAIEDSAAEWSVDGGDLTCVLNLNTEPLVKFARCGALTLEFILDDPSNHILYFSEMHQVQPWHSLRASGDDAQPRDTPPFDGVVISTKSLGDLREAVRRLAEKGGAKVIGAVAVALLAVRGAFAATVQTVPLNDLDYDVNPPVVTNVTFEGLADATNVYTKAETEEKIVELAPAPGNYAVVSNAAMSAKTKLSAIFNMDNPTAVPKAVEAQESESASFASEANKAYNLFAEGEEPESRSSIDIFAAIDAALRKDKQNSEVQTFGGLLSGFGFHADTGHNDNGWNQYTAHNGTALSQPLPAYIGSNPWGFLKQGEAIPTTGGVFNAYIHLNHKFSVGTWTQYVKPIESVGGSGIAFAFGDNVQTRAANTMVLGVGALNTNNWSFIWNGDANRMYLPTQPNMSNPYSTRHNGGFHVNPSVRSGMTNPLQNFWIGDTNLNDWISVLAPTPTWDTLSGKPTFATVATSGAYSDLSGKPTIPTTAADVGAVSTNGATMTGVLVMNAPIVIRGNGLRGVQFGDTVLYLLDDNGLPSRVLPYSEIALTSDIPTTMAWSAITGKPTTISGYGITDALKSDFTSLTNNAAFTSAVAAVSPPTDTSELEARGFVRIVADDEIYFVTITTTQTEE